MKKIFLLSLLLFSSVAVADNDKTKLNSMYISGSSFIGTVLSNSYLGYERRLTNRASAYIGSALFKYVAEQKGQYRYTTAQSFYQYFIGTKFILSHSLGHPFIDTMALYEGSKLSNASQETYGFSLKIGMTHYLNKSFSLEGKIGFKLTRSYYESPGRVNKDTQLILVFPDPDVSFGFHW